MTTILRQRSNYVANPRGRGGNIGGALYARRRNRFLNPRQVSGSASVPASYVSGTTGTVARTYATPGTAVGFPNGIGTARQTVAPGLGTLTTDRAGEYVDVLAVTAGQPVTVSVYVRRTAGSLTKRVRLSVEARTSAALVGTATQAVTPTLTDTTVRRLSVTITPGATADRLRVYVYAEGIGSGVAETFTFQGSGYLVEDGSSVRPYFDGGITPTNGTTYAADDPDYVAWSGGAAHASPSVLSSVYVDALTLTGTPVKALQPPSWLYDDTVDPYALGGSYYLWTDRAETVVRFQPYDRGTTLGPRLVVSNDPAKAATFAATMLVEARLERATPAGDTPAQLRATVNGATVTFTTPLTTEYALVRVPVTLVGGGSAGLTDRNVVRLGKTGLDPVLVRAVALVDEASYAGPYFDGDTDTIGVLDSRWENPQDAPLYSASYQGIPSLSVVATAEAAVVTPTSAQPPRVRLDVADTDPNYPARVVTVERIDSSGRRSPVRGTDGDTLELTLATVGRAAVVYDYEAPLGVSSSYVLTAADNPPSIGSARVTPNDGRAWLVHPGVPTRSRPLSVARIGARKRRRTAGVNDVHGRADPIVRTDGRRKSAESELVVRTYSDADRELLDLLLEDTSTLLLSVPIGRAWGIHYEWIAVGDVEEDRTAPTGTWPRRVWALPYRVVGRPIGGTRAARSWHDVALEAPSWRELARQRQTWADVADPAR